MYAMDSMAFYAALRRAGRKQQRQRADYLYVLVIPALTDCYSPGYGRANFAQLVSGKQVTMTESREL
ncbi:hypothetical protein EGK14_02795 [Erwinia sp. 198]|nr:hypothetical protein EGK14_02795 [Erwinia sp. 198]